MKLTDSEKLDRIVIEFSPKEEPDDLYHHYLRTIAAMSGEILRLRAYRDWAIRTRCGDVMEWERLIPASGGNKKIPKRHFNDNK